MGLLKRIACAGIVPLVVLEDAKDAVHTAKGMVAGGIDACFHFDQLKIADWYRQDSSRKSGWSLRRRS